MAQFVSFESDLCRIRSLSSRVELSGVRFTEGVPRFALGQDTDTVHHAVATLWCDPADIDPPKPCDQRLSFFMKTIAYPPEDVSRLFVVVGALSVSLILAGIPDVGMDLDLWVDFIAALHPIWLVPQPVLQMGQGVISVISIVTEGEYTIYLRRMRCFRRCGWTLYSRSGSIHIRWAPKSLTTASVTDS